MQIIKNETVDKKGTIKLTFADETVLHFPKNGIRAGLSWPQNEIPAFYVILGMEQRGNYVSYASSRLHLLAEKEVGDLSLQSLFQVLGDDCKLTHCRGVYGQTDESFQEYASAFYEYKHRNPMYGRLVPAFFPDNFDLGVSLIRDHVDKKLLELPRDSILLEQLRQITRQDLKDNPEKRFFAINALRHSVASFFRNPPVVPGPNLPDRSEGNRYGWMGH